MLARGDEDRMSATSEPVQVFGCRHDEAIHALRRPASEKRQGTKSREVGHRWCRGRLWRFSRESRFLSPCDFKELGVAKRSLSTTSARSAVRQPWSIIARKAATNLNVVQPKLFQATRQDDLRFSDCTVSVIQILDDADAA